MKCFTRKVHSAYLFGLMDTHVLVSNTECKDYFCLFTRTLHRAPLSKVYEKDKSFSQFLGLADFSANVSCNVLYISFVVSVT